MREWYIPLINGVVERLNSKSIKVHVDCSREGGRQV